MPSFTAVHIVRRAVALLLILASVLLLPGGAMPAMAMTDHSGIASCPHAVLAADSGPATHKPIGLPTMPQCCYALPTSALVAGMPGQPRLALPGRSPRPGSDNMPTPIAVGPDVPPPRS